jgi:hypothetical protein
MSRVMVSKRWLSWLAIATALLIILGTGQRNFVQVDAAMAQRSGPKAIAAQLYQQYPQLPLENQYVRKSTKEQAQDSTLLSRLIEYHTVIKGRAPNLRLDWKLTWADYLGLNEYLVEDKYPGHAYLKSNPMERDRDIIATFNRKQRTDLTQSLVNLYSEAQPAPGPPASAPPTGPVSPASPPGASRLLDR